MQKSCCIDVDGVLNYYPQPWLHFLKIRGYPFEKIGEAKSGLSYEDYNHLKTLYRHSVEKRHQPPRKGATEFTAKLTDMGYHVILKTSRPIQEYPHLIDWTQEWLKERGFTYNETIFNRHHPTQILDTHSDLEFIVDDTPDIIIIFQKLGIRTFLFDDNFDKILEALR